MTGKAELGLPYAGIPEKGHKAPPPKKNRDIWELSGFAFLYTCGFSGRSSVPRYVMTIDDAKKWCGSPLSKGVIQGNPWAYFFTSIYNYITCHWGKSSLTEKGDGTIILDLGGMSDDGRMDEKLKEAGVGKFQKKEIEELLKRYGIKVKF